MEPVLRAHLHSFPLCQYRQGWRFLSYQQSSDFVDYLVQEIASGIEQRIRCRYLVSCEGAHSGIRRAMEAIARWSRLYLQVLHYLPAGASARCVMATCPSLDALNL